ncbi:MAG: hypothetical protein D6732_01625 [Methanobacteriota archaeon]|nr:MAG: hypothetical protein D6732_01625 [Euryarchaeota archaeon]
MLFVFLLMGGCSGRFLFDKPGIDFKAAGACAQLRDGDRDKKYDDRIDFRFDKDGRVIEQARDETNDGSVDQRVLLAYDNQGRLVSRRSLSAEGDLLEVVLYRYDAQSRLVEESIDDGGNGTVDLRVVHEYQDDGQRVQRRTYRGNSKEPESVEQVVLTAGGKELRSEMDSNNDGKIDRIQESEYDAEGHLLQWRTDDNNDGQFDSITVFSYDKQDNRIEQKRLDRAGNPMRLTRYFYDKFGNRYGEIEKDLTDGSEIRTFYDYSCWRQ